MKLTLRLAPQGDAPAETRILEQGTLTLGRSPDQDWVLGDPERTISKLHCRIDSSADGFLLTDLSTNGVFLNANPLPLGRGHAHALADGDQLLLGPYTLLAAIEHPANEAEPEIVRPATHAPLPAAYTGVPQTAGSPLAPPPEAPWLEAIPNGGFGPGLRAAPIGWEAPPDPNAYSATGARPDSLPPLIPPTEFAQESEHLSAISTLMRAPAPAVVLPTNWNDIDPMDNVEQARSNLAESILAPTPAPTHIPVTHIPVTHIPVTHIPEEEDFTSPLPVAPAPAPLPSFTPAIAPPLPAAPIAADASPPPEIAADLLLAGFLEASGLAPEAFAGIDPREAGRDLGRLVRDAIEGVRDVLATRAMVKAELRVDQTIIQARDNNAMKFAPDVQRCLDAMIGAPPTGFMPGSAAMRQSLDDIKRHELALVAALNSVFTEISTQLDPEAIRTQVRTDSSFGSALPMMREAACWDIFEQRYAALQQSGDAQNTGGSLLSPLAVAYATQVRGVSSHPSPQTDTQGPPQ